MEYIWLAAMQSPPGELSQMVIGPEPDKSSSLKSFGVTSSSNHDSDAISPLISRTLSSGASASSLTSSQFQNFFGFFIRSSSSYSHLFLQVAYPPPCFGHRYRRHRHSSGPPCFR